MPASIQGPDLKTVKVSVGTSGIVVPIPDYEKNKHWALDLTGSRVFYKIGDSTLLAGDPVTDADDNVIQQDIEVDTVDTSTTYTVTLNGVDYDYVPAGGDGEPEILAGLRDAINAGGDFVASATATVLTVRKEDWDAFTVATSVAGGTGTFLALSKDLLGMDLMVTADAIKLIATEGNTHIAFRTGSGSATLFMEPNNGARVPLKS